MPVMPTFDTVKRIIDEKGVDLGNIIDPSLFIPEFRVDLQQRDLERVECTQTQKGREAAAHEFLLVLRRHAACFLKFLVLFEKLSYDYDLLNDIRKMLPSKDITILDDLRVKRGLLSQSSLKQCQTHLPLLSPTTVDKKVKSYTGRQNIVDHDVPTAGTASYLSFSTQKERIVTSDGADPSSLLDTTKSMSMNTATESPVGNGNVGTHPLRGMKYSKVYYTEANPNPCHEHQNVGTNENVSQNTFWHENKYQNNLNKEDPRKMNTKDLTSVLKKEKKNDTSPTSISLNNQQATHDPDAVQAQKNAALEADRLRADMEAALAEDGMYRSTQS